MSKDVNQKIFNLGIFLLPSALSLGLPLLFFCSLVGYRGRDRKFFSDNWNIYFVFAGLAMILSSMVHTISYNGLDYINWRPSLTWIGLLNWIPFFICFWGLQSYVDDPKKRKNFSLLLLAGSLPVLITGIGQSFFNWYGPMETLNGLIIWYSKPIESNAITGLTGLFNNANYAGSWLNIIWPFALSSIFIENSYKKKFISFIFIVFIALCIVLTNSRAAWLGLFFSIPILFGVKGFKWIIFISAIFSFVISFLYLSSFNSIIPTQIISNFQNLNFPRIDIWQKAIDSIISNPFFGKGAASFPDIYQLSGGEWKGHAHNLVIELMFNYGIPAALLVVLPILLITILAYKKKLLNVYETQKVSFDKAIVSSLIILIMMHLVDITYLDGRISIIGWILLAASRKIIDEENIPKRWS